MPALTADRATPYRDGDRFPFPVAASTRIYAGAIVAVNTSSLAVPGAATATLKCVGVAQAQADNSAGAAGAINVDVRRGCFRLGNSSAGDLIALADVGSPCYVVDDNTVAKTSNSNARPVAGTVRHVDAQGVWVEF